MRLWSHDPFWQAEYVVKFFEEYLLPHFEAEEKFLFPLALLYVKKEKEIVQRLVAEHAEMRNMVESFRHPDQKKLECTLEQFGKLLESHIRCEERELFPICEQSIPALQLADVQGKIEAYRHQGGKP